MPATENYPSQPLGLAKPDSSRPDDSQAARGIHFEHSTKAISHKRGDCASARGARPKQHDARMLPDRIALKIGDALVQREQDSITRKSRRHYLDVRRAPQIFLDHRIGIVAECAQIDQQLNRNIFIQLDFHSERIGTKRSS